MSLRQYTAAFPRLDAARLDAWRALPPAAVSDCLNRAQTMAATIKPLAPGMRLCGQARTVTAMVGDNSAAHAALRVVAPGDVLVVDGRGFTGTAIWGGLMTQAAMAAGLGGLVVDGAVRDVAEICELGFPCFAAGAVPAGPHKGFGGTIDGPLSCGGCPVMPGDLVLGDDDGVVVVPLAQEAEVYPRVVQKVAAEEAALEQLKTGVSLADQFNIPTPEQLG